LLLSLLDEWYTKTNADNSRLNIFRTRWHSIYISESKKNVVKVILCVFIIFFSIRAKSQDSTYHFVTSDGVSLYLRTAGTGYPCLFIHGGPGNTSHYFEPLPAAKMLEQQMRMIYYDQRGGGRSSSAKDSNYSIKRMEQDIE
jgi:proline iminopeptidase